LTEPAPTGAGAGHVLETGARLSASRLWQLQRDVYNQQGVQAWSSGTVPQSITTSAVTARAYARVVLGYLRDIDAQIDDSQPVYVVELGGGSGRFGFRFIKHLSRLLAQTSLQHTSFVYIMTDVTSMVDYWQTHPMLRPLVESGVLDFSVFDAAHPAEIRLIHSGKVMRAEELANPMVVVANYLFDSIPQDCFSVSDGTLYENLVTIRAPSAPETLASEEPPGTPEATETASISAHPLRDLEVSLESHPVGADYYAEPALDAILDGYRQRLDAAIILFPIDGMRCLQFFQRLAARGILFVIGDIGTARELDITEQTAGGISADSNFWLSVNFHALGEFIRGLGGTVLHPPSSHANLNVSTFVLGPSSQAFGETRLAYAESIGDSGPDDFAVLTRMLIERVETMQRGQLLTFLRSTAFDPDYVVRCVPLLLDSLPEVSWSGAQDLRLAAEEAWEMYYPMGDTSDMSDLAAGLGVLLYTIGDYPKALEYFLQSLELIGIDPRTTYNLALCTNRLARRAETISWLEKTLELDPSHDRARELLSSL
jgi:tetratricopeptide (TPR) repeat protein